MRAQSTIYLVALVAIAGCQSTVTSSTSTSIPDGAASASGSFNPTGPPSTQPERIFAGGQCIVDLTQNYDVAGSLTGRFVIDYRILVKGPCGSPPGTHAEEWIAHGMFSGEVDAQSIEASLTYLASSNSNGDIRGKITLADGLRGDLDVNGNFSDGRLEYDGWIHTE